jgi:hypothetical protein
MSLGRHRPTILLGLVAVAAASSACGTSFVPVRLSEPASVGGGGGAWRVEARRVLLTDDVLTDGVGDETALVVELTISNGGPRPASFGAGSVSCLMELDAEHPGETRALTLVGGSEGTFPGEIPEGVLLRPMEVPPGGEGAYWLMFRGYRYPASDLPRRIALRLPGANGRPVDLVLADPARGAQRWNVDPVRSAWTIGFRNTALFGHYLTGSVPATELAREVRLGRFRGSLGFDTAMLVETRGALISQLSSFSILGLSARVVAPVLTWGLAPDERQIGVYLGAGANVLVELRPLAIETSTAPPHVYGALALEAGLELAAGTLRFAGSPFPLSPGDRPLPRWSLQLGYAHWWVGHGSSDGYVTSFRLSW